MTAITLRTCWILRRALVEVPLFCHRKSACTYVFGFLPFWDPVDGRAACAHAGRSPSSQALAPTRAVERITKAYPIGPMCDLLSYDAVVLEIDAVSSSPTTPTSPAMPTT
ncbi:hypothetical protein HPB48_012296 [Haemaphysalis longicornis]|uniref:Uncharacterized protein n=1 Tax=Haemaphysalis longicornis TaxID=44386 RepID=A0A9J6GKK1_HAELO|nr:hypothetical protein HPB48_012296 [Haemaphysalis longicornis]